MPKIGWCICITKAINNGQQIAVVFKADNCRDDNKNMSFFQVLSGGEASFG